MVTNNQKCVLNLLNCLIDATCPNCKSLMEAIIVPPSFFKDYQNFYLNQVWNETEKQLTDTQKIIFCGYSFPDSDIYIKYLLKRAEMLSHNNIEYYIVNNHPNKSESDKNLEKQRYQLFFNNKNKVVFTELSFEEFARNPNKLLDMP